MGAERGGNGEEGREQVDFHYIKTSCYRSYHVDGVFGGLTPSGGLYMELFIERLSTPQSVKYKITPAGDLQEISRSGKSGVIREIEAGLIMDINTAKTLREWLDTKISEFEARAKKEKRRKWKRSTIIDKMLPNLHEKLLIGLISMQLMFVAGTMNLTLRNV